ncbi:unnamed protein product [Trichobilharzia regenti]|nr:unnamed protein product [Trichobilharzia regenti]
MEIFRLGEVGPPKDDDFQRFKGMATDETNWKRRYRKKNVEVYTRSTPHTSMKMIKVVAIFPDVPSDVIYDMMHDNSYRSSWDNTMRESTPICRITWNCYIEHFGCKFYFPLISVVRAPFAFANRDFVLLRAWKPYEHEYIIYNRSVFHKIYYLAGHLNYSHVCGIIEVDTKHFQSQCDIPSWAINLATTKVCPRLVKTLHRAALRYPAWKAQNRPEFAPWRNPEQQDKTIPELCPSDILKEPDFPLKKVHENRVTKEGALKEIGLPPDTKIDEDSS